jgi:beta-mannosidase
VTVPSSPAASDEANILAEATWECSPSPPGRFEDPDALAHGSDAWLPASVPGTAAAALRDAGRWSWGIDDEAQLDGQDWWFRCLFEPPDARGPWELELGGLATIADVWLNGVHLLHSENMFVTHVLRVERLEPRNELTLRFAALSPILARRHPRPRWKSLPVRSQSLRWYRTTCQGRLPGFSRWAAPVGPWRPVELRRLDAAPKLVDRRLEARCVGEGGEITINALVRSLGVRPAEASLCVGDERARLTVGGEDDLVSLAGTLSLAKVDRWWPHTHGDQPLYPVRIELDGSTLDLGSVGFRTIAVDRTDGAFRVLVNDLPIFCRGATWGGHDPVTFRAAADDVTVGVERCRDAGMNMLRVAGYSSYAGAAFWDACDELGILVWQDCMLSTVDPPEDSEFWAGLERELRQVFGELEGRPSLAVACGGTEIYQQAAMFGLPINSWRSTLLEETIPNLLAELVPGVPYLPTTPFGGELPFDPQVGTSHYFGIGAFMHPLSAARTAGVRFASECLAFGIPPEPETVVEQFGDARVAGHDARWKSTVARDPGMSWDYEDATNHYVSSIFGVDPVAVRYQNPERALDLARAAVAEAMSVVLTDWRRRTSPCDGALILGLRDAWPGAGWGLVDSTGRPKAPLYAVSRVFAPLAVLVTDERLSGLHIHVFNEGAEGFSGVLRLTLFGVDGAVRETCGEPVQLGAHGEERLSARRMLGGFRELTDAFRFAPASNDVVLVELLDASGSPVAETFHLPGGPARPLLPALGLEAILAESAPESFTVTVSTRLFAQYVAFDVPGFVPSDSWFHLAPGKTKTVTLRSRDHSRAPTGTVRALNSLATARVAPAEAAG